MPGHRGCPGRIKCPFPTQANLKVKKMTCAFLRTVCRVSFGSSRESPRPPSRTRNTSCTCQGEGAGISARFWSPFVLQPHADNNAANVVNVKCPVMLGVLNISCTALQPTLLSALLSVRHLRRRGLEALEGRLYGRRMNNSREVDRRD